MPRINFVAVQNPSISNKASVQELENMFLEPSVESTKGSVVIRSRSGSNVKNLNTVNSNPNHVSDNFGSLVPGHIFRLASTGYDATDITNTIEQKQIFVIDTFSSASKVQLEDHISALSTTWEKQFTNANSGNLVVLTGVVKPESPINIVNNKHAFYVLSNSLLSNTCNVHVIEYKLGTDSNTYYGVASGLAFGFCNNANYVDGIAIHHAAATEFSLLIKFSITNGIYRTDASYSFIDNNLTAPGIDFYIHDIDNTLVVTGLLSYPIHFSKRHNLTNTNICLGYINPGSSVLSNTINGSISLLAGATPYSPPRYVMVADNDTHTLIVYENSDKTAICVGSVVDGEIVYSVQTLKSTFHNTPTPVEVATGFSNIVLSGDASKFLVTDRKLQNAQLVTKPGGGTGGYLAHIGGVYYYAPGNSDIIYASEIDDPATWPASRYATAEYNGDSIKGLLEFKDYLYVFGGRSTELWYQTGDVDFPMSRMPNGIIPIGAIDRAYTKTHQAVYIVGYYTGTLGVWKVLGTELEKISTYEIDQYLTQNVKYLHPYGYSLHLTSYQEDLHTFIQLNHVFIDHGQCFCYDELTKTWHRRSTQQGAYPFAWVVPENYALKQGKRFAYAAGPYSRCVAELRSDTLTDAIGDKSVGYTKKITSQHIVGNDNILFHNKFRIDTDKSTNATIVLLSKDYNNDKFVNHGAKDADKKYLEWWRLGASSDRVYSVLSNSNIQLTISDAFIDVAGGTHLGK